ncbi:flagellin N-terminal helical domain-containing protein [Salipiger bermudensis]|uniref:Flagellin n=1 Tax=Salipiger bermudensis (strain DSM 26914 / JCM 13377 / KCTC 12554 / HTCC2601) TaxID=314265 RepID=Q0FMI0_SALBH|nr:flagellin [Salipiger bermudensis]EAU45418.1 flagellin C protein [Salipiger bermudensis HTCC2601]MAE92380.1 flagellar protein [Pelagibaca sp.]
MSSINTNASAMSALSTLRQINSSLESTQSRISTGLKVESGKDNAAYFQISETMKGDSSVYASINEGLTLTKNSVATARLGAETINDLGQQFLDKVAFAQGATGGQAEIENDLNELVKQMKTTLQQSTFNGDDMLAAGAAAGTAASVAAANGALTSAGDSGGAAPVARNVVTGITRAGGTYATTSITVDTYDVQKQVANFEAIATGFAANADAATGEAFLAGVLASTEGVAGAVTDIATKLGQSEKSLENQQEFLSSVVDNIDAGVGSMIDANMEEEAARLQALQVQQQLATQSLSIANQAPQNILSLFR